ncbi:MAG: ribosome maturation factor RimP [Saprospiraceae bacterium]
MVEHRVKEIVLEKLAEPGFEDFYLLEVKFNPANKKVEVFLDSDSGMTLGHTSKINRFVQNIIDEKDLLGERYILDISSPGVGKPLLIPRQYKKNIGRKLDVHFEEEGKTLREKGILTKVNETGIVIQYDTTEKMGKKKIKKTVEREIVFETITKAVVKISF